MPQQVKRLKDLPPWFKLANYAALAQLDAIGWLRQFVVRASLKDALLNRAADAPDLLIKLRDTPIVNDLSDPGLRAAGEAGGLLLAARGGDAGVGGAFLATVMDHLEDARALGSDALSLAAALHDRIKSDAISMEEALALLPQLEQFNLPIAFSMSRPVPRVPVYLDMSMPDWLLEQQLKDLLREARSLPGVPSASSLAAQRPKPESWIKFGVLPYLDLQLWALETDSKIVNRIMADAIYPAGEGGDDTVRTSTASWAAELSNMDYLRLLAYWAATRKSELSGA